MSRLVLSEVDGSPAAELMALNVGRWLNIIDGDIHSFAAVRQENVVKPTKLGQTVTAAVLDHFNVKVAGAVWGDGVTPVLRRASFRDRMDDLRPILGNIGNVVRLVAHPPVMGLVTGETATIDVQFERWVRPDVGGWEIEGHLEIHFVCVTDPPAWIIEEAS